MLESGKSDLLCKVLPCQLKTFEFLRFQLFVWLIKLLERLWVSWINSGGWRQFAKSGPGSMLLGSDAYAKLAMSRRYASTWYRSRQEPELFQDVQTFCVFIGHTKSGSSLVGSLLDAHENIIMADEADALKYVLHHFSKQQIYHILLKASKREAMKGRVTARRLTPYSLQVADQWQGRYTKLKVIGDSKAGITTQRFGRDLGLIEGLQEVMPGVNVKFVHVIRNPFDPISLMMVRGKRTAENAMDRYFANCEILTQLHKKVNPSDIFMIRYEDFVGRPKHYLTNLCSFLGVPHEAAYVDACVRILHPSPERSRDIIPWETDWIKQVQERIAQYAFLDGYTFET